MSNVGLLLSRLEKVKKTGIDRWQACCPVHGDKNPSMSVRLSDNDKVLIHCHAQQCDIGSIVAAVGMELTDLFPERIDPVVPRKPERKPWRLADILPVFMFELTVAFLFLKDLSEGMEIGPEERERAGETADRLLTFYQEMSCAA